MTGWRGLYRNDSKGSDCSAKTPESLHYGLTREVGAFEPSVPAGAKLLDSAYVMTRYPDSIVGNLTPSEYYDREDAGECIEHADSICSAARRTLFG